MNTAYVLGDSLSAGNCSYDWVKSLKRKKIVESWKNVARDGSTASVVRHHLASDLLGQQEKRKSAAYVIIMVGGNDVISSSHLETIPMYNEMWPGIHTANPGCARYKKDIEEILRKLDLELDLETEILLMSAPPIGEGGVDSEEWKIGLMFSNICSDCVYRIRSRRIEFINMYDVAKRQMLKNKCNKPFKLSLVKMYANKLLSSFVSWSWLRWLNGYKYTHDGVHFCRDFGDVCESVVTSWILQRKTSL